MWHHCVTTLELFYSCLGYILNQCCWELKSIANYLINADAEEHILPLTATLYPIPVNSKSPLPVTVIPSLFTSMVSLTPSPPLLPTPNHATHLRGGDESPTNTPAPSTSSKPKSCP